MPEKAWKKHERSAGVLVGGRRHWANSGQKVDVESDAYVCQCKNVRTLSLAQLEALAVEVERQGFQRSPPKLGLVIVKRRAGHGRETPSLVVMTSRVFAEMNGAKALDFVTEGDAPCSS